MVYRIRYLLLQADNKITFCGIVKPLWMKRSFATTLKHDNLYGRNQMPLKESVPIKSKLVHLQPSNSTKLKLIAKNISTSEILMQKSEIKLTRKEKFKKAVQEYGSTVIIFHISISLASLGFFYLLVSSGIDMQQIMDYFGVNFKFAQNAGTFVTAYAVHKLFAPVRISITLGATPLIVRYLRNKGILKKTA